MIRMYERALDVYIHYDIPTKCVHTSEWFAC